ncbi:MAG: RNA polymerase sigma factor [Candidatus Komeilibacteria bacterium]|nr:RNA polymerase sigma factor [Candidatus Komeilibacteria bacterium]
MQESSDHQDKVLLIKAGQGDANSFGALFDKYYAKIYRFIFFKVSSKETAEDLTSQTFLKCWEHISQGNKVDKFQPWLYRISRNLIVDYFRSREKEELPLIYQESGENEIEDVKVDPGQNLSREELEKIIFNLKSEAREIILLRYIEDLSIQEISKIVDKSAVNVRVIIHRSIKELQQFIKE